MAPIEFDWGEQVQVGDQETFVRNDTNEPLVVKSGETVRQFYALPSSLIATMMVRYSSALNLEVMADSEERWFS